MRKIGFYCNWNVLRSDGDYYISSIDLKYINGVGGYASKINLLCSVRVVETVHGLEKIDSANVDVIELPEFNSYFGSIRYFWSIVFGLKKLVQGSDFVYLRSPEPFSWLAPLFKRNGVILNYHYASSPIEVMLSNEIDSRFKKLIKIAVFYPEYMMIAVAAYFNKASVNGQAAARKLPFFLTNKVKVAYESSIAKFELDQKKFREVLDCPTIRFLSVGRLQAGKGLFDLIDAFGLLYAKKPEMKFTLTIVGDGPMKSDLESRVEKRSLGQLVNFSGNIANGPDLNSYYAGSDVFVMTSHSETGPRVLIEALSESNFCISTDVGYVREVLCNESGLIIESGSVAQIYDSLCWVFNNRVSAKNKAYRGFLKASRFSIDSFFYDIIDS
jgi:glycosyltransferase involved in cell wall biosynthesis